LKQPDSAIARNPAEARSAADKLGYPVMIRPSYVLGGRAMEIVADGSEIDRYVARLSATLDRPSELVVSDKRPLLAHSLSSSILVRLEKQTRDLALALNVVGLMNVQYAVKGREIYILEVNPRASRTVPFVAKVIGKPIAGIAARVMNGEPLASFKLRSEKLAHVAVKEAVDR